MMIPTVAVQGSTGRGAKASAAKPGTQTYADFDMWESWDKKAPGKVWTRSSPPPAPLLAPCPSSMPALGLGGGSRRVTSPPDRLKEGDSPSGNKEAKGLTALACCRGGRRGSRALGRAARTPGAEQTCLRA